MPRNGDLLYCKNPGMIEAGCDEAGRGPLAGPVFAAAVILPPDFRHPLLDDSKKLTPARREELATAIRSTPACTWAVASATPDEIDRLNILRATHLAMHRAVGQVIAKLGGMNVTALIDGLPVKGLPCPSRNLVKGDAKSLFIAAASILAKTSRDADCLRLEALYPGYGFAQHKGYPTAAHLAALARLGPCPEHRRSFGPVSQMMLPL